MKKKSITVTWFYGNYGSILQAFALQKILNKIGVENEIVNYIPNNIEKIKFFLLNSSRWTVLKDKIESRKINKYILTKEERIKKEQIFKSFNNSYLNFTKKYSNQNALNELSDRYDYYFCGSDQIWNPSFFKKCQFLSFVSDNKPKISYAPSIGKAQLTKKEKNKIKPLLERFTAISVREEQGAKLIESILFKSVKVVCDPVFLLSKEEWENFFGLKKQKDEYILCYFLGRNKKHYEIVKDFSKKTKIPIKTIPNNYCGYRLGIGVEKLVGPLEWLNLIYNAKYIFTDSFHATAFSLIFNKNFYTVKRFNDNNKKSQNTRIYNLLNIVDLKERIIEDKIKCETKIKISNEEWKNINKILEKYKGDSLSWLIDSISKEE